MKTIAEDKDTITIRFTRDEAASIRSAINYIAAMFEYIDREALDLSRISVEAADQIADEFSELTTAYFTSGKSGAAG